MPRIADLLADCSVYLYRTVEEARSGSHAGGSGFLAEVPSKMPGVRHLYAVTNKHVIDASCGVLRLSLTGGGVDTIPTKLDNWRFHPSEDDIAVLPISFSRTAEFRWAAVNTNRFLDQSIIEAFNIGYGDEVFMAGRLVTHSGKQRNAVVLRFGNISLMADLTEPIACEGRKQEGFLIECRSLSGFSGSPVFVMTSQNYAGEQQSKLRKYVADPAERQAGDIVSFSGNFGPWLLGIDWGHIPAFGVIDQRESDGWTRLQDYRTELNSGIACVSPAWKILELLNDPELVTERQNREKRFAKQEEVDGRSVNDSSPL